MARAHHQSQALFGGKVIREPRRMLDRDAGFTPKRPGNRWGTGYIGQHVDQQAGPSLALIGDK
jgi:hypothetical protein